METEAQDEPGIGRSMVMVASHYSEVKPGEPVDSEHPAYVELKHLEDALAHSPPVRTRSHLTVVSSPGKGRWAEIPWVVLMDSRETRSTQRGVYCAWLYRADCTGVYLCLMQGTEDLRLDVGSVKAAEVLRERAAGLAAVATHLEEFGFHSGSHVDLRGTSGRSRSYEQAIITSKLYPLDGTPDDTILLRDLEALLAAYNTYALSDRGNGPADAGEEHAMDTGDELHVWSWTRPRDVPGLIGRKCVDWSLFRDGSAIPQPFIPFLTEANGGQSVARGDRRAVVLEYEGATYEASLVNLDRPGTQGDTVHIRWTKGPLTELLQQKLPLSYAYIARAREERRGSDDRSLIRLPDDQAEYLDFFDTGEPFRYRLGFVSRPAPAASETEREYSMEERIAELLDTIAAQGYRFAPWQVTAYVMALRTKPFVILAGGTGTGKSKLPALVAKASGGRSHLLPVRPDWTDSSEVLGYLDLQSHFRPGPFLSIVQEAWDAPDRYHVAIMDEMNLGRVEHYFAEILSRIEDRHPHPAGGFTSGPLLSQRLTGDDARWSIIGLPPNLGIVGTVNMDESAHGFSRKVLDRSFTIEISDTDISAWPQVTKSPAPGASSAAPDWPAAIWSPNAVKLQAREAYGPDDLAAADAALAALQAVNAILVGAQLQVGYRTRDEVVHFVLNCRGAQAHMADHDGTPVDPLDLALLMKILPRVAGGSMAIRRVIHGLLGWAHDGHPLGGDEYPQEAMDNWQKSGRSGALRGATYPRTAGRLCLMLDRLMDEGFTSFWT